jgi:hypothetical protein
MLTTDPGEADRGIRWKLTTDSDDGDRTDRIAVITIRRRVASRLRPGRNTVPGAAF